MVKDPQSQMVEWQSYKLKVNGSNPLGFTLKCLYHFLIYITFFQGFDFLKLKDRSQNFFCFIDNGEKKDLKFQDQLYIYMVYNYFKKL